MDRRRLLTILPGLALTGAMPARAALGDEEVLACARRLAAYQDDFAYIAAEGNPYGTRLANFARRIADDGGLDLSFKVYLVQQANAFALADGSIRVYSGLMDVLDDDELRFVVGHEIGHVRAGHSKARMERSLATIGRKDPSTLTASDLRTLVDSAVFAPYSVAEERAADEFALQFMNRNKTDNAAALSALRKFARFHSRRESWITTHPAPAERAQHLSTLTG